MYHESRGGCFNKGSNFCSKPRLHVAKMRRDSLRASNRTEQLVRRAVVVRAPINEAAAPITTRKAIFSASLHWLYVYNSNSKAREEKHEGRRIVQGDIFSAMAILDMKGRARQTQGENLIEYHAACGKWFVNNIISTWAMWVVADECIYSPDC